MINLPVLRKWSADVPALRAGLDAFFGPLVPRNTGHASAKCDMRRVAGGWHFIHGRDIQKALAKANDHPTGSSDHSSKFPDWPT